MTTTRTTTTTEGDGGCWSCRVNCGGGRHRPRNAAIVWTATLWWRLHHHTVVSQRIDFRWEYIENLELKKTQIWTGEKKKTDRTKMSYSLFGRRVLTGEKLPPPFYRSIFILTYHFLCFCLFFLFVLTDWVKKRCGRKLGGRFGQ